MTNYFPISAPLLLHTIGLLPLCLAFLLPFPAAAQDAVAPPLPVTAADESLSARPGEKILADRLVGLRFLSAPGQLVQSGFSEAGMDVTRTPLLQQPDFLQVSGLFLDKPMSKASLDRMVSAIRSYLNTSGHSFTKVYLMPQDITGGHVQVVVEEALADTAIDIVGAEHFSEESYRAAIRQQPGKAIDSEQLEEDIAWLNRNHFRQVQSTAVAGSTPGSTRLGLRVADKIPLILSVGADNTGQQVSGQYREFASLQWGNVLGFSDSMNYRYSRDPAGRHFESHSGSYAIGLPWRHALTLSGAWSQVEPLISPPFAQLGTNWQLGAEYEIPFGRGASFGGHSLTFSFDFKYSDNTLLFAANPVTNNITHILQFGAAYSASSALAGGNAQWGASVYASPGNLTQYNTDADFDLSTTGAKAQYGYVRLFAQYDRPLPYSLRYFMSLTMQGASTSLLGTEQVSGGGTFAVRGYRENAAFGDEGVVLRNELHLPALMLADNNFDTFAFLDAASLRYKNGSGNDLGSIGLGFNYRFRRNVAIRAAAGHQLNATDRFPTESNRGHIGMTLSW
jgi:hemolysin activation/secretion protein